MKLIKIPKVDSGTLVAQFGNARLIRKQDGSHLLTGGTRDDRCEAREWISLFLHEATIRDMN